LYDSVVCMNGSEIIIIDYGLGNLRSMANMLNKIGANAIISSDPEIIEKAEKLILPGVGAFDTGMKNLTERGLIRVLNHCVLEKKIPIMGVCLGMQLMTIRSEEGELPGLGWVKADTIRFKFENSNNSLKVPHMGWEKLTICQHHKIFTGLEIDNRFYFVHSYHIVCAEQADVLATTTYGFEFTSVFRKDNIFGVQFHPEKSHKFGMLLLKNYLENT
jgi:imidazole glycerol-phosphate synthase subunit HisH